MAVTIYLYVTDVGDETNILNKYPLSGENWFKVSEHRPHDGDDTYLYTNSDAWQRDLYTIEETVYGGTIDYVRVLAAIKVATYESGDTCYKMAVKTHGTVYESAERARITTGVYSSYNYITWATNPNTGDAWSWDEIAALQIGIAIRRQPLSLGEVRVSSVHLAISITGLTLPESGHIWTEGDKLHFISGEIDNLEGYDRKILGADTGVNTTAGHLFVDGYYLHFVSQNGDERRQMGKLTGAIGTDGHIWIDDMWIYYVDSGGYVRELGTWILGSSTLGVDTILHA